MNKFIISTIILITSHFAFGQVSQIKNRIENIIENKQLELGFALYDLSTGDTLSINGSKHFPMQSVFKFPLALAMLHEVDKKNYELNQKMLIEKKDLLPGLWSPIQKRYPDGDIRLPLSEIIKYTVAQSDNVGCDFLLKVLGGALNVNKYMHSKGVTDICIKNNEQEIQSSWSVQFENWTTPKAMTQLLKQFNDKKLLLSDTHNFLWNVMAETSTGSIRNKLPGNAIVVHKTGSSGYNHEKISAATNDVGIMSLPNGKQIAFAIFVTNSKEAPEVNADVIAEIAALLYALQ